MPSNDQVIETEPNEQTNLAHANTGAFNHASPTLDENNPNFRSEVERANVFSYVCFGFLWRVMRIAFRLEKEGKMLDETKLSGLSWSERPEVIEARISRYLEDAKKKNPHKSPSLAWAVIKSSAWGIFLAHFLEASFIFLRIFLAYTAYKVLNVFLHPEHYEFHWAYIWSAILSVSLLLGTIVEHHAFQHKTLVPLSIRGALISLVYTKINKLSVYSMNQISLGKLVNIVANDVNVMEKGGLSFTNLITGSLGLMGGTALLWILFDETCLVGIGYLILTYPLQNVIIKMSVKHRAALTKVTDERIKLTSEVIDGIRLLKMYTWELVFRDNINAIRRREVALLWKIKLYDLLIRAISINSQYAASFLFFLSYNLNGGALNPAIIFPAYYLIGFLRVFATFFIAQGFVFYAESNLLFKRISAILDTPEVGAISFPVPKDESNSIEFEHFSAFWTKHDEDSDKVAVPVQQTPQQVSPTKVHHDKATITGVNMNLKQGSLNAIVGKVGSGKTSFLLSFTGEMPKTTGSLRYRGSVAYVEQEPTIFAGSIREGILFGKPFKPEFYAEVIKNCNLENDLKLFSKGDMSDCGEKGVNLSGGQKARLALARAVYADADIYLLDDPLSAVDAKVAKSLYENAIKGMLKSKTVILATHQVHFVKELENIMVIDEGRIVAQGDYQKLKKEYKDVDNVFVSDDSEADKKAAANTTIKGPTEEQVQLAKQREKLKEAEAKAAIENDKNEANNLVLSDEDKKIYNAESVTNSYITFSTYGKYAQQMGGVCAILAMLCSLIITQFTGIGFARILSSWAIGQFSRKTSLAVEGSLAAFSFIAYIVEYALWYYIMLKASTRYHDKMLNQIVRNPVQFFDSNAVGRILNRFSNDMGVLDTFLPSSGLDVVDFIATIVALVLTLAIVQPQCIGPVGLAVIIICVLVHFLYPAIKQSRNYELMSRSPLYSQFSSTLSGIVIIRSYKQVNTITNKFRVYLNNNVKGSFAYSSNSRALGFYVDTFYSICAVGNVFIVCAEGKKNPGISAFALILIISINGIVQYTLRQLVQTHLLMASASRAQSYCQIPSEAALVKPEDEQVKKSEWPQNGKIDFNGVFMKYRPDHPFVIKGLDIHALPGEKVGCIGRTGAGKSSIVQTLFRMVEVDRQGERKETSGITIDGVDIQKLGLHLLRSSISIIPQTPFIFSDTIRKNIDPIGNHTDEELWRVLEDVNLKRQVEDLEDGLNTDMTNASSVFSVGQKQLICLARTILKKSKILVLDEATANVDKQTDDFIQATVMKKFGHCTIFTIAHRLSTIANYDKVLVMDKGRKVEFDEPYRLLVKHIGDDTITNTEGDFASMVLNTGARTSREILQVAKETYERKHGVVSTN